MSFEVGELYGKLGLDTKDFDSGLDSAGARFEGFGSKLQSSALSLAGAIGSVLKDAAMIGGAAIVGAATLGTKAFADYEQGLANVKKTVGYTTEEAKAFGETLRELSKQTGLSVTALEEIASTGGSIGIAKDSMEDFTKSVAIGTVALGVSQEELATAAGKWMQVFQIQGPELTNALSAVNELENTTAAKSGQLVSGFEQLASIAPKMGMGFNQANAYLATQVTYLGDVEKAATGLDSAFNQVLQSEENINKSASVLGVSTGQFIDMMKTDGLNTMHDLYLAIDKAYSKEEAVVQKQKLFGTYGQRAMTAINQGWKEYTKNLQTSTSAFQAGNSVMKEFDTATNTTWGSINRLKAGLNDVGIEIGQNIAPSLNKVVSYMQDKFVPAAKAAVQAFFSGDWNKLGGVIKGAFDTAISGLKTYDWTALFSSAGAALSGAFAALQSVDWSSLVSGFMSVAGQLAETVQNALSQVNWVAVGSEAMQTIAAALQGLPGVLVPIGQAAAQALGGAMQGAGSYIVSALSNIDVSSVGAQMGNAILSGLQGVAGFATWAADKINGVNWSALGSSAGSLLGNAIVSGLRNGLAAVPDILAGIITLVGSSLAAMADTLAGGMTAALNGIMPMISQAIGSSFETMVNGMLSAYNYVGTKLYDVIGKQWEDIKPPSWLDDWKDSYQAISYNGEIGSKLRDSFEGFAGAVHGATAALEGLASAANGGLAAPGGNIGGQNLPPAAYSGLYTGGKYVKMEDYLLQLVQQGYNQAQISTLMADYQKKQNEWIQKNPGYRDDLVYGSTNQFSGMEEKIWTAFDQGLGKPLGLLGEDWFNNVDFSMDNFTQYTNDAGQHFWTVTGQSGISLAAFLTTGSTTASNKIVGAGTGFVNALAPAAQAQSALANVMTQATQGEQKALTAREKAALADQAAHEWMATAVKNAANGLGATITSAGAQLTNAGTIFGTSSQGAAFTAAETTVGSATSFANIVVAAGSAFAAAVGSAAAGGGGGGGGGVSSAVANQLYNALQRVGSTGPSNYDLSQLTTWTNAAGQTFYTQVGQSGINLDYFFKQAATTTTQAATVAATAHTATSRYVNTSTVDTSKIFNKSVKDSGQVISNNVKQSSLVSANIQKQAAQEIDRGWLDLCSTIDSEANHYASTTSAAAHSVSGDWLNLCSTIDTEATSYATKTTTAATAASTSISTAGTDLAAKMGAAGEVLLTGKISPAAQKIVDASTTFAANTVGASKIVATNMANASAYSGGYSSTGYTAGGGGGGVNTWSSSNAVPSTAYVTDSIFTSSGGMFDNSTCEIDELSGMSPGLAENLAGNGVWKPNSYAASQAIAKNVGYTGYDASGRQYVNGVMVAAAPKATGRTYQTTTTSSVQRAGGTSVPNTVGQGYASRGGGTRVSGYSVSWGGGSVSSRVSGSGSYSGSMSVGSFRAGWSKGGLVRGPTVLLAGEAGPELILNAEQTRDFMKGPQERGAVLKSSPGLPAVMRASMGSSGMGDLIQKLEAIANRPVVLQVDGRTIGKVAGSNTVKMLQEHGIKVR